MSSEITINPFHRFAHGALASGEDLRGSGIAWDLRKQQPYCGYETYDFESIAWKPTDGWEGADSYARFRVRLDEMWESLKIVKQCAERLEASTGQPVMVEDKKIAWPARLAVGPDGQGNSHEHIKHIMGESMEALIHHFKLFTEGIHVPAGEAYAAIEHPKGEFGIYFISDGSRGPLVRHAPVLAPLRRCTPRSAHRLPAHLLRLRRALPT